MRVYPLPTTRASKFLTWQNICKNIPGQRCQQMIGDVIRPYSNRALSFSRRGEICYQQTAHNDARLYLSSPPHILTLSKVMHSCGQHDSMIGRDHESTRALTNTLVNIEVQNLNKVAE